MHGVTTEQITSPKINCVNSEGVSSDHPNVMYICFPVTELAGTFDTTGRCRARISTRTLTILTKCFVVFLRSSTLMLGDNDETFVLFPSQFITHLLILQSAARVV